MPVRSAVFNPIARQRARLSQGLAETIARNAPVTPGVTPERKNRVFPRKSLLDHLIGAKVEPLDTAGQSSHSVPIKITLRLEADETDLVAALCGVGALAPDKADNRRVIEAAIEQLLADWAEAWRAECPLLGRTGHA